MAEKHDDSTTEAARPPSHGSLQIEPAEASIGARPECFRSTVVEILYVLTCTMAIAMQALLVGSVTVVTNKIGEDLQMTQVEITWIIASSSLSCGAFLLFFGRLTDLMGRKVCE